MSSHELDKKRISEIPFVKIGNQDSAIDALIRKRISEVVNSGTFLNGQNQDEFEKKAALYLGANYSALVSSGTAALMLSVASLACSEGAEVITTPFTFFATVEAIISAGLIPRFVDIDPNTFCIDAKEIEKAVCSATVAIMPVHLFGNLCNMMDITRIANNLNLHVVEDCAQSFGVAFPDGKRMTRSVFCCYSFYPTKNLGAYGDAGLVVTNSLTKIEHIKKIRNHGMVRPYEYEFFAGNSRCDEIQAAVLCEKLSLIDELNEKRRYFAALYIDNLAEIEEVILPKEAYESGSIFHQFTIRVKNRNALRAYLHEKQIMTEVYYAKPLHLHNIFSRYGYLKGDFPVAEKVADEVISLPIHPGLEEHEILSVARAVANFYGIGIPHDG